MKYGLDIRSIRYPGVMSYQSIPEGGIYFVGFFYPVVPRGKARIRVQISAAHSEDQILKAVQAFIKVRNSIG
jgi:glycine C-acetyltransferase